MLIFSWQLRHLRNIILGRSLETPSENADPHCHESRAPQALTTTQSKNRHAAQVDRVAFNFNSVYVLAWCVPQVWEKLRAAGSTPNAFATPIAPRKGNNLQLEVCSVVASHR